MPDHTGSWLIIDTATTHTSNSTVIDPAATDACTCRGGASIVRVFGEIDLATHAAVAAGLERVLAERPRRIVVDGTAMAFCSVGGLGALMSAVARGAERGIDVAVVGFSPLQLGLCAQLWPGPQPTAHPSVTDAVTDAVVGGAVGDHTTRGRPAPSVAVTA